MPGGGGTSARPAAGALGVRQSGLCLRNGRLAFKNKSVPKSPCDRRFGP